MKDILKKVAKGKARKQGGLTQYGAKVKKGVKKLGATLKGGSLVRDKKQ